MLLPATSLVPRGRPWRVAALRGFLALLLAASGVHFAVYRRLGLERSALARTGRAAG